MKRILLNAGEEYRLAMMEDGRLIEMHVERPLLAQKSGQIYKGIVVNVLPGMQAAFVNIGQGRNAYLYIDDILPANLEQQPQPKPSIADLVQEGQQLLVQITKEPSKNKGARVTTHFSLPGRYLVYMPYAGYVGVSRKIEDDAGRQNLKCLMEEWRGEAEGIIVRTAASAVTQTRLNEDLMELRHLWQTILERADQTQAPGTVYEENDVLQRWVQEHFQQDVDQFIVSDGETLDKVLHHVRKIAPELTERVSVHRDTQPLSAYYDLERHVQEGYASRVSLRNGGYVVIDQTEALTVIDVNSGRYTGTDNLQMTILEINREAAEEIGRLIRLQDIGGIIIVDFIDMNSQEQRALIRETLEAVLKKDRVKTIVVGWTTLGLLEITRKKTRDSSHAALLAVCSQCGGRGRSSRVFQPQRV